MDTTKIEVGKKIIKQKAKKQDENKMIRVNKPMGKTQHGLKPAPYHVVEKALDEATKRTLEWYEKEVLKK